MPQHRSLFVIRFQLGGEPTAYLEHRAYVSEVGDTLDTLRRFDATLFGLEVYN